MEIDKKKPLLIKNFALRNILNRVKFTMDEMNKLN